LEGVTGTDRNGQIIPQSESVVGKSSSAEGFYMDGGKSEIRERRRSRRRTEGTTAKNASM
jgi:hypothetical protein